MWRQFLVLGLLAAIATWIFQRYKLPPWIRWGGAIVALLLVALFIYFSAGPIGLGESDSWYRVSPNREVILFVTMLFGMAARYVTKAIEVRRGRIAALEKKNPNAPKPPIEFDLWEFSYPLFVSVVTFGAVLAQTGSTGLTIANVILSFQTGFFWQTILARQAHRS